VRDRFVRKVITSDSDYSFKNFIKSLRNQNVHIYSTDPIILFIVLSITLFTNLSNFA